jgi:hypothetical protein
VHWLIPLPIDFIEASASTTVLRHRTPPPKPNLSRRAGAPSYEAETDVTRPVTQTTRTRTTGAQAAAASASGKAKTANKTLLARAGLTKVQEYLVLFFGAASLVVLAAYPRLSHALGDPEVYILGAMAFVLFGHQSKSILAFYGGLAMIATSVIVLVALVLGYLPGPPMEMATNLLAIVMFGMMGVIMAGIGQFMRFAEDPGHLIEIRINRADGTVTVLDMTEAHGERSRQFPLSKSKAGIMEFRKPMVYFAIARFRGVGMSIEVADGSKETAKAILQQLNTALGRKT